MTLIKYSLVFSSIFILCNGFNILVVMPFKGKSHQMVFEPLFKKLASVGHNVTFITRRPIKDALININNIDISPKIDVPVEMLTFDIVSGLKIQQFINFLPLAFLADETCREGLNHPEFQKFLKQDNHFDVILIEMFNTPCFMCVAKRFKAPVIGMLSGVAMPWLLEWFGTDSNPSYIPNHFTDLPDRMSFIERVENVFHYLINKIGYYIFMDQPGRKYSREFTGIDLNESEDVMRNISMLFLNSHYSLGFPRPLPPNVLEIGGIQLNEQTVKPLPQYIEKFIQESKHGVIYMSMGSVMKGDTLPEIKRQAFLRAFSRLPQRIIWKWEGKMDDRSDNVMISKWTPQVDILCHSNVKAFVSHGGLGGILESINCATPLLLMPLFGDQFTNAKSVEKNEGGLILDYNNVTEDNVYNLIQQLLTPKYQESIKELSMRYNDRPISALDSAVYWVEYIARHKGASFIRSAATNMPLYQYCLLDVIAFILFVGFIFLYICYLLIRLLIRKLFKKQMKLKKT